LRNKFKKIQHAAASFFPLKATTPLMGGINNTLSTKENLRLKVSSENAEFI
jgi:hypothetical protein